jgi:hypothetical protein
MRLCHSALVFRVKLNPYEEGMLWNLYNLHESGFRVNSCGMHAVFIEFIKVLVVELVAMPMPLFYLSAFIYPECQALFGDFSCI